MIYDTTLEELRHYICRTLMGGEMITGSITSPGSGTFICTDTAWQMPNDHFNNWREVYCYNGTGDGTSGKPTDWDSSTNTLTFAPAATLTTGDDVELHREFLVDEVNEAINLAIESVAREALLYKYQNTICCNSVLSDGFFDETTITTYWTADGNSTLSRDTTYYKTDNAASAKLVTDGTNVGYFYQSVTNYPELRDQTFNAKAWIWADTADRVRLKVTDGVETSYSDYADAGGWYEYEVNSFSIDDDATEFTVSIDVTAGAAVTLYADAIWCAGDSIYEYDVSTNFLTIHRLEVESSDRDIYDSEIPWESWGLVKECTRRIKIDSNNYGPISGRRLRISGMQSPATISSDSTQCPINPEFLAWQAAAYLHAGRIRGQDVDSENHATRAAYSQGMADKLRAKVVRSLPPGSRWVTEN